ncbi:hypothetical protein WOLCODRAFT_145740 [Wolfiporia cocos MD-104 SS10]|uniref:Uncharacterized protein n=1 Tax=Wolfiporia cocos (strain MD-104) TaxID=742152 RepID=A0A2H3J939_WOLCO|nr:hypothetical protein WOLCODRAFT_145740 [Wolfiporia cocos MD-104 SS10]
MAIQPAIASIYYLTWSLQGLLACNLSAAPLDMPCDRSSGHYADSTYLLKKATEKSALKRLSMVSLSLLAQIGATGADIRICNRLMTIYTTTIPGMSRCRTDLPREREAVLKRPRLVKERKWMKRSALQQLHRLACRDPQCGHSNVFQPNLPEDYVYLYDDDLYGPHTPLPCKSLSNGDMQAATRSSPTTQVMNVPLMDLEPVDAQLEPARIEARVTDTEDSSERRLNLQEIREVVERLKPLLMLMSVPPSSDAGTESASSSSSEPELPKPSPMLPSAEPSPDTGVPLVPSLCAPPLLPAELEYKSLLFTESPEELLARKPRGSLSIFGGYTYEDSVRDAAIDAQTADLRRQMEAKWRVRHSDNRAKYTQRAPTSASLRRRHSPYPSLTMLGVAYARSSASNANHETQLVADCEEQDQSDENMRGTNPL